MAEIKRVFMLLGRHTDDQYSDFLSRQAQKGWWLTKTEGNFFIFKRKPISRTRVACYSTLSVHVSQSAEDEFYDKLPSLRKDGWDLICLFSPSSLLDKCRHAAIYEKDEEGNSPIPLCDKACQDKLKKNYVFKALGTLAISLLVLCFTTAYLILLKPSPSIVFTMALTGLSLLGSATALIRPNWYRALDYSVLISFISLIILSVILIVSFWY